MDNNLVLAMMFGVCFVLFIVGIYIMSYGFALLLKDYSEHPRLKTVSQEYMDHNMTCKPHSWERTTLALRGLDPGKYLVCTACGIVSGHMFRLNEPALEVLRNNIRLNAEKETREAWQLRRTQEILEADFNFWIKSNFKQFGKSEEEDLKLLRNFSVFTVSSVNDAAHRAIRESKE